MRADRNIRNTQTMSLFFGADRQKIQVLVATTAPFEAAFPYTGSMRPMPTNNNTAEPNGSTYPDADEMRKRLQGPLADLDVLGESLAAIHVQTALDCLGRELGGEEIP